MKKDKKNNSFENAKGVKPVLEREIFYKGDEIIKQGETGNRAYYIEQGQVEVSATKDGHTAVLNKLEPGEIFGEIGMLDCGPRSATVTALTDCIVTVISHHELDDIINSNKDRAVGALLSALVIRLREANMGMIECHKELKTFQDLVTGLTDKSARKIDESERVRFRKEVMPLLKKLEELLDSYRKKAL